MFMAVLSVCLSVHHTYSWFTWKLEEGHGIPCNWSCRKFCEPLCGCLELNLGLLEERPVLLNTESATQSQEACFLIATKCWHRTKEHVIFSMKYGDLGLPGVQGQALAAQTHVF